MQGKWELAGREMNEWDLVGELTEYVAYCCVEGVKHGG